MAQLIPYSITICYLRLTIVNYNPFLNTSQQENYAKNKHHNFFFKVKKCKELGFGMETGRS